MRRTLVPHWQRVEALLDLRRPVEPLIALAAEHFSLTETALRKLVETICEGMAEAVRRNPAVVHAYLGTPPTANEEEKG